ncbi:hypothetical protein SAMN05444166_5441 [Singulisphaera sp. GP187]|uniref:hypothetical protein n=1 Tax=Singulisphaera sp. GP187 TaxID=1882752 RepID=UPI000928CBD8|nr:hypothetical protein [Singulisphaera sp. GP187]SIO57595.1 hypothetical protein SAMN05444166_5441 [Singulisphaera sp. GP187]
MVTPSLLLLSLLTLGRAAFDEGPADFHPPDLLWIVGSSLPGAGDGIPVNQEAVLEDGEGEEEKGEKEAIASDSFAPITIGVFGHESVPEQPPDPQHVRGRSRSLRAPPCFS